VLTIALMIHLLKGTGETNYAKLGG